MAKVLVEAASSEVIVSLSRPGFSVTFILAPGELRWFDLPLGLELRVNEKPD